MFVGGGFFSNLSDKLREAYIHIVTGHLQISHENYDDTVLLDPYKNLIPNLSSLRSFVESNNKVLISLPNLRAQGILSSDTGSISTFGIGTDPAAETAISEKKFQGEQVSFSRIVQGKNLSSEDPLGIVLGAGVQKALHLKIGDTVTFISTKPEGAIEAIQFKVRGIFESAARLLNDSAFKIPIESLQKHLGIGDQAQMLYLILDETKNTDSVYRTINENLKQRHLKVLPWSSKAEIFFQSKKFLDFIFNSLEFVIYLIFFFTILNTLNLVVQERMREYGTMRALGAGRGAVVFLIFSEFCIIALVGFLVGMGLSIGASKIIALLHISINAPAPAEVGTRVLSLVAIKGSLFLHCFLITCFSLFISFLIPTIKVIRMPIVRALQFV